MALLIERKKPRIVVSLFFEGNFKRLKEKMEVAKLRGADAVELRIDAEPKIVEKDLLKLKGISERLKIPVIFTLRSKEEGGKYDFPFGRKLKLIKRALQLNFDYLDIELKFLEKLEKNIPQLKGSSKTKIILSYHNLKGAEGFKKLREIKKRMLILKPDVIKIAVFSKSEKTNQDILKLIRETKQEGKKIIGISMGEKGREARLKAIAENEFSYFSLDEKTAPGQISLAELNLINWRKELDKITENLIELLAKRNKVILKLAQLKKKNKMPILDKKREKELIEKAEQMAKERGLNAISVKKIIKILIADAKRIQKEYPNPGYSF